MRFRRYAIFHTPAAGGLADFGAAWLGWDAAAGRKAGHPDLSGLPGLPRPLTEITETPRKYGLHGTMKPPFRLRAGQDEAALRAAFARFCATEDGTMLDGLELARLGRFLALVPVGGSGALNRLAAATVRAFDPFRAPLNTDELARRRARGLSARQEALLAQWGYPFVIGEFRYHITLTGRLPRADAEAVKAVLQAALAPLLPAPWPVDTLSLMGEDAEGYFHLIDRRPLRG